MICYFYYLYKDLELLVCRDILVWNAVVPHSLTKI